MKILRFEDIIGWQKAQELAVIIYRKFGKSKDYGFRDQICRASVSISNNIAEGFNRKSNKQFSHFLYISLGSNSEVKSMCYLAEKLGYLSIEETKDLISRTNEIGKIINGLINSLKTE